MKNDVTTYTRSISRNASLLAAAASFFCAAGDSLAASLIELGSGATTEAIIEAVNSVDEGGVVQLAAGTYSITNMISLSRGITVQGVGPETIIDCNSKCRAFYLSNANAKVLSLTVQNGNSTDHGGGIRIANGTVSDCVIKNCKAAANQRYGGGVFLSGGVLSNSVITGCNTPNIYSRGNALGMTGGLTTGCDIYGNNGGYSHSVVDYGDAVVFINNGTIEKSKVHDNNKDSNPGIVIYNSGKAVNCLVYGNKGKTGAGGIYIKSGSALHNTVYGNSMTGDTTGRSGLFRVDGTVKNNIFWGNGPEDSIFGSCQVGGGAASFVNNLLDKELAAYPDNRVGAPGFVNADSADFRISHQTSAAYGAGTPLASVTDDYLGNARDSEAPTAGAYEFVQPIVDIPVIPFIYANGEVQRGLISDTDDYTVVQNEGGAEAGFYDVVLRLKAPNAIWADGRSGEITVQFEIKNQIVLTATAGNAEITAALAAAGTGETILFTAGTYSLTETIVLDRDVTLKGVDRDTVILDFANNCRGVTVSHKDAVLRDITIYRGAHASAGGGVSISAGTVTNCLIKNCWTTTYQNRGGGGAYLSGGMLVDSEITGCYVNGLYGHGNAVYLAGGTVRGCDIHNNDGGYSHTTVDYGSAVVCLESGVLERSKIHHNTKDSIPGIAMYKGDGIVRNCLIYGNKGNNGAGGIYMKFGSAYFNTVYGNVMNGDTTGRSGIWQLGGDVKNNIFWNNGPDGSAAGSCVVSASADKFTANVIDKALLDYPDNRTTDPKFTDPENGDFSIAERSSSACGYAVPMLSVLTDITGFTRSQEAPTAGAYEFDPSSEPFLADILIPCADLRESSVATVYAIVGGAEFSEVDIKWYLDGAELPGETGETLSLSGLPLGYHSLAIEITRKSDGVTVSKSYDNCLGVRSPVCYVNTTGTGTFPFDTPEKGTNSLKAALATVWTSTDVTSVVHIAAGTYTNNNGLALLAPIRLIGEGRDSVTFYCKDVQALQVAHEGAEVSGITIAGAGSAWGFIISKGAIRNCRVVGVVNTDNYALGAAYSVSGGTVEDCEAINCGAQGIYSGGGGLYIASGLVSNMLLKGCWGAENYNYANGGSLRATGGTIRGVTITGTTMNTANGAAINASGGTFESCIVTGNTSVAGHVISMTDAVVKNCLFANNDGRSPTLATVVLKNGKYTNCTIAGNTNANASVSATGIVAGNSIFADCGGSNILGGTFTNCNGESLGNGVNGNISVNPLFRGAERGDFHLRSSSPCVNKGDWTIVSDSKPEVKAMVDLDGRPRLCGGQIDIGCYENQAMSTLVELR